MGSRDVGNSVTDTATLSDLERVHVVENTEESKVVRIAVEDEDTVGVVGSGNFGKAIATKLKKCGVSVLVGSRSPSPLQVSIGRALQEGIVILAVPTFCWEDLPLGKIQPGTVIIDCSNRTKPCKPHELSQAERLQQLLPPGVNVVKCFNTISAYELENQNFSAGQQIPLAGNSKSEKEAVGTLLDRLGYHVSDMGNLEQARVVENIPLSLFPNWKKPFLISVLLWVFLYFLTFARYHFCFNNTLGWFSRGLDNMFVKYINKTCDNHALILLVACYLPGVLAAYLQLFRGTKYSQFPNWLDDWLKMRKQFGVFMLFSASMHACFYLLLFEPWFGKVKIPTIEDDHWNWEKVQSVLTPAKSHGIQLNMLLGAGIIAYFTAMVLGVTSLPSVSLSLSWKEFRLIQSFLGWLCLLLSTAHCVLTGWARLIMFKDCIFLSSQQVPLILPAITILLKLPLLIPFVDKRLTQIRQGKLF